MPSNIISAISIIKMTPSGFVRKLALVNNVAVSYCNMKP